MSRTTGMTRRTLVAGGAALGLAVPLAAVAASVRVATPYQTPGPFYPDRLPLDHDNDLLQVAGQSGRARGTPTYVAGRVLTEDGRAMRGVLVELWQCDANGVYHHPRDRRGPADPNFQGYGRTTADAEGGYRFRTIRPVVYPGRTPHIHFAVSGPGVERLTTQMYVAGEPDNARDGLLNRIADPAARASVIVDLVSAPDTAADEEPGALSGRFDIVLGRSLLSD